jgi:hypothetical protein
MKVKTLTILFLTLLISSKSLACDCKILKSLKELQKREFTSSKYIFIGEVFKIDIKKNTFEIKVTESFKGVSNGKIYRGIYSPWCGPIINKTGKWLIYADRQSENLIEIRSCGLTRNFKSPENNIFVTGVPEPPTLIQKKSKNYKAQSDWKLKAKSDLANEITDLRTKSKSSFR